MTRLFKSLHSCIWLGLFAFCLVTVVPAIAQQSSVTIQPQQISENNLSWLSQGRVAYQAGRYAEAVTAWQQAQQQYQIQGDRFNQALSLSYLSLAHQKLGQWQQAEQNISLSLKLLQANQSELKDNELVILAQALNTQGSLQLALGNSEAALNTWQQAADTYRNANDKIGELGSQINQVQALQSLGFYRRGRKLLDQIQQKLDRQTDPLLKADLLRSLGTTLQLIGNLNQSQEILNQSLALTQQLNLPEETAATLFSLGNTARLQENYQDAIAFYQQAIATTLQPLTKLEAQLNLFSLLINTEQWQASQALLPEIQTNLAKLSPSRSTFYAQVNFAKNLIDFQAKNPDSADFTSQIQNQLQTTLQQAQGLQDQRAESYALGILGHLYEQQQQWSTAQQCTEQALQLAQTLDATDIAYQWQWQLGRILKIQGNQAKAIASYTEAVNHLKSLRGSLVAINPDLQFSFRDRVEPVYRELVELLLDGNPNQKQLQQAREVIESLQLAELENFFQEACLKTQPRQIDEVDATAAVIYPIILSDRLAVILSLPDRSFRYYSTYLPQEEIENTIESFYQSLSPAFSERQRLNISQQIYDWLIRSAEADLTNHDIKTLAFVLDGSLRNIPMASLYDGKQYLIEKYNVALTPGLQLLPSQPFQTNKIQAVIAGISKSNQGFAPLPGVQQEIEKISAQLSSQSLLNEEFTNDKFQEKLQNKDFSLVHLATHGQFSSNSENTFIVTWNNQINVKDFENLLRRQTNSTNPIQLMVLSACQTAAGDRQAALGMAGMAVRSGARSTLATLWSIKDQSTALFMNKFYQELFQSQLGLTKAEALRKAQLTLLHSKDFNHPFYWAPFVLVGNWL